MPTPSFRAVHRTAACGALLSVALAAPIARATAPAPADTGLFAPVARQLERRLAAVERLGTRAPSPDLVAALIASGRVDEAAGVLDRLEGDPGEVAAARLSVHLARQDYAAAGPLVRRFTPDREATDAQRQLYFTWLFGHDDAAAVDRQTRGLRLAPGAPGAVPELLAAGRLAYDLLNYARAESCHTRALEALGRAPLGGSGEDPWRPSYGREARAEALAGLGRVLFKRRDFDGSLAKLVESVGIEAAPDALEALGETLIRLGRTDEAITANQWAVRLNPYHEQAHYYLGNGYARKNYTELAAAYPAAFADSAGRRALAHTDDLLASGRRSEARAACGRVRAAHPSWADAAVRLASLEFEEGRFDRARDLCFDALRLCPEYGRAHAVLARTLESQRFAVDVHRAHYERRFAAAPEPEVAGIDSFVVNWRSLSPRHQKRVALSIAPWKHYLPVLVAGGATYYIKPMYQLLSETPGQETLRDQRIGYDSRLWDDVRGAGGYHTVTGIEDVERTIFDRYNTVLHELTHQVHAVLTADQSREIQELYRRAKVRDDSTREGFMSRYAAGSVHEYFAEGANALESPKRDAYDPREVVRERLRSMDSDLEALVKRVFALDDVSASYPVAFVSAGDDRLERGRVDHAVEWYGKALARSPREEAALESRVRALTYGGAGTRAAAAADSALAAQPGSGSVAAAAAAALWHGGRGLGSAIERLERARVAVRAEDRWRVDLALGRLRWTRGDAPGAIAAYDSVLAWQSDQPEGLWGRAAALALEKRWDEAFAVYGRAVRLRTGIVDLRCDHARDLLRARRIEAARVQLDEAKLLDLENPTAEALRGWVELEAGRIEEARAHARRALEWGPWCELARIVSAMIERRAGNETAAREVLAPVRERIGRDAPPGYVYRPALAVWQAVHELPAVERELLPRP